MLDYQFEKFLTNMNFRDLGDFFIRGQIIIRARYEHRSLIIEDFRTDSKIQEPGELDAFLDMLVAESVEKQFSIIIEVPGPSRQDFREYGFQDYSGLKGALVYNP